MFTRLKGSLLDRQCSRVKDILLRRTTDLFVKYSRLSVDEPIYNESGLKGLVLVASYTDKDENFLPGLISSCDAFEKIILYHDRTRSYDFRYNEGRRFQLLISVAKKNGAEWVFIGSPKTRFSEEFKTQIAPSVEKYRGVPVILALKERYLWGDFEHYAYINTVGDGVMIEKLFTVTDDMKFDYSPIHAIQHPINYTTSIKTNASRYYLGRFNLAMMKEKSDFYHSKDGKDYSFLSDVSPPQEHNECILGIGDFERQELL